MKLVSEVELKRLLQRAMTDQREQGAFFRALLGATVYAHVPISDDTGRLRFAKFARPDNGELVLPFFADESEPYATAGAGRRVVALPGRTLLSLTLGATLLFDPNGARCSLYPEEVRELLASGTVAILETEIVQANKRSFASIRRIRPGVTRADMVRAAPNAHLRRKCVSRRDRTGHGA